MLLWVGLVPLSASFGPVSRRAAVAGQLPLLVLMVALAGFGLFLLFWR